MGGGERKRKSGPFMLDWNALLDNDVGHDRPPRLVVVKELVEVEDGGEEEESDKDQSLKKLSEKDGGEEEESDKDQSLKKLSEKELHEKIARAKQMLSGMVFNDGGEKLRATLKSHELEMKRRMLLKGDENCKKATHVAGECTCAGATEGRSTGVPLNVPASQSIFSSNFRRHLGDNIGHGETKAFRADLSTVNPCDHKNARVNGDLRSQSTHDICLSSRQVSFKSPSQLSINIDEPSQSNSEHSDKDATGCFTMKAEDPDCRPSRRSRRNNQKSVVVVDEEEMEDDLTEPEKVDKSIKENRIYYPSRDDPKAIEICYKDVECLDPESYLSCTIMNFYIRYLQKTSLATTEKCNYHFFNTYFYKKLQRDVLDKIDRETSFVKFRRWWKGVNIFEKAYIFIPIHETYHWSLVIICIPDKEDESGPIILHLDSLGLHASKSIFNDVKSFLIEEWKYMREGEGKVLSELPFADKVWDKLSRRIIEKVIEVPQQKNVYDCGLFVLFFMERFLDDAPERIKKKDLDMFGRQWFRPEQASSLRLKIRNLLKEEFAKANEGIHNLDS